MGPTGSGKTALAEALSDRWDCQLINADAFQVYRGMDIGTGKSKHKGRYKLLDLVEPTKQFSVGEWLRLAADELQNLWERRRGAILVGGTGLYIRALMEEYADLAEQPDPQLRQQLIDEERVNGPEYLLERLRAVAGENAQQIDTSNPLRVRRALERALSSKPNFRIELPPFRKLKLGLDPPAAVLRERIATRISDMVTKGWIEEVRSLRDTGITESAPGMKAIGYRTWLAYLRGELKFETALEQITVDTRQYAKRQRTWLRKEPNLRRLEWSASTHSLAGQAAGLL